MKYIYIYIYINPYTLFIEVKVLFYDSMLIFKLVYINIILYIE